MGLAHGNISFLSQSVPLIATQELAGSCFSVFFLQLLEVETGGLIFARQLPDFELHPALRRVSYLLVAFCNVLNILHKFSRKLVEIRDSFIIYGFRCKYQGQDKLSFLNFGFFAFSARPHEGPVGRHASGFSGGRFL